MEEEKTCLVPSLGRAFLFCRSGALVLGMCACNSALPLSMEMQARVEFVADFSFNFGNRNSVLL